MTDIKKPSPMHVFDVGKPVIVTRFLESDKKRGNKVRRPDRIRANTFYEGKNKSVTVPWDHSKNFEDNHRLAVGQLLERMGWGGPWAMGTTETGYVAVSVGSLFIESGKDKEG